MKKFLFYSFILLLRYSAVAQLNMTGVVRDYQAGQPIENAIVTFEKSGIAVVSDSLGRFSVQLPAFESFSVSHIAYELMASYPNDMIRPANDTSEFYADYFIYMIPKNNIFAPVYIISSRADFESPVTFTNITGKELAENNFGEDMPMLLEFLPSVVVTSDAGNGVGYTGIRIRGSDATRVNVTVNGVPFNDAESQQSYWVDLPDFASSVEDVQVQRGVGMSVNGISSFGGAININTNKFKEEPYASVNFSAGSFNLFKTSASFGTGEVHEHWFAEGRISKINTDGYIDRSFADLSSFFLTGAYRSNKYTSTLNIFSGEEHTYQSWGGVPKDSLETNRTYNPYTYENQTDNYTQTHYQLHQGVQLNYNSYLRLSLNYTKGYGYYEQLEEDQYFSDYNADPVVVGTDTILSADLITQKWLDNDFYGAFLNYETALLYEHLSINTGAAFYNYAGDHFGKVVWSEYASSIGDNYLWYRNDANKQDGNIYLQMNLLVSRGERVENRFNSFNLFADLQVRTVTYAFTGFDDDALLVDQEVQLLFFNPKIGATYQLRSNDGFTSLLYASLSRSFKEPNRDDYVESSPGSRPSPETLYDLEAGHKLKLKGWQLQTNIYYMHYIDQLVLNGQINDVGEYTRINVPESYRAGIEVAWATMFFAKLNWNANFTLSQNRIKEYTEYIDNWDTGEQLEEIYRNTTIAFSPAVIASNRFEYFIFDIQHTDLQQHSNLSIALQSKFVGRQFIDNTASQERSLDPYFVNDISLQYSFSTKTINACNLKLIVQNVFDHQYESNAWVYRYLYEGVENELNGYFPQAGRNFVISCGFNF